MVLEDHRNLCSNVEFVAAIKRRDGQAIGVPKIAIAALPETMQCSSRSGSRSTQSIS
jgi:hypothetical protein